MIRRDIYLSMWQKLSSEKQMIFLSGPRQAGKTTFSKEIAKTFTNSVYFSWDILENKKTLMTDPAFFEKMNRKDESPPLVIFDEIHKYKNWKNYIKGIYDQFFQSYKFLVLGSGSLDIFQKGGDSLAGRYFNLHLMPFTIAELSRKRRNIRDFIQDPLTGFDINLSGETKEKWETLSQVGGFPEPYVKGSRDFYINWFRTYAGQIIREDIRNFAEIKNIDNVEILFSLLPAKVGSLLSIANMSRDIQVSFGSIKNWLRLFELQYLIFQLPPWTRKVSRAILKEKKLYLFHYPEIEDEAAQFENMTALELLRAVQNWNEQGAGRFSLHYIRNKEKEEVDFLLAENNKPMLLVETKFSDETPAKALLKFQNILHVPAVQLVNKEKVFRSFKNGDDKILIVTAHRWLSSLP